MLGFGCWVEKPCYRQKCLLFINVTCTQVLADSMVIAASALNHYSTWTYDEVACTLDFLYWIKIHMHRVIFLSLHIQQRPIDTPDCKTLPNMRRICWCKYVKYNYSHPTFDTVMWEVNLIIIWQKFNNDLIMIIITTTYF